jgi:hypothetical protein
MSFGKIALYFLTVIVFGLFQLVIASIILWYKHIPFDSETIMKNGSVFFFSTSLVCNNLFIYLDKGSRNRSRFGDCMTAICLIVVMGLSICAYAIEFPSTFNEPPMPLNFTGTYFTAQVACGFCAVVYSFYVGCVTGLFQPERSYGLRH